MRQGEPVIEESRVVEDVHHLRLMALLHELVREKGNRGAASALGLDPRTVASCMKTGRLSWRVRERWSRGYSRGQARRRPGSGSATTLWRVALRGGKGSSEAGSTRLGQPSQERSRLCGRSRPRRCGTWSGDWCGWRREGARRTGWRGHPRPARSLSRRSEDTSAPERTPSW